MTGEIDTSRWSGEGAFTQAVVDRLRELERITFVRVEDAPATRSEADYNFISNEIYVAFATESRVEQIRRFGLLPARRTHVEKIMTMFDLEAALTLTPEVGPPDYSDDHMLQYLKAERVIPPYQTRGYKVVELLRIYEAGTEKTASTAPAV
jgi:hypothetical protein